MYALLIAYTMDSQRIVGVIISLVVSVNIYMWSESEGISIDHFMYFPILKRICSSASDCGCYSVTSSE